VRRAAVNLGDLAGGADPVVPIAGVDGLVLMVPLHETETGDAPPVAPDLVQRGSVGDGLVWTRGVRSGWTVSGAIGTDRRATYAVQWTRLTEVEATAMRTWIDELDVSLRSWPLAVDGPGASTVLVRFVEQPKLERDDAGGSSGGVWHIAATPVEQTR